MELIIVIADDIYIILIYLINYEKIIINSPTFSKYGVSLLLDSSSLNDNIIKTIIH